MTIPESISRPLSKAELPSAAPGNSAGIQCYRFELQLPSRARALWMGGQLGAGVGFLMAIMIYVSDPAAWAFNDGFGWLTVLAVGIGLGTCGVLYLLARQPRPEPWLCLEANGVAWGRGQTREGEFPYDQVAAVIEHREPERLTILPVEEGEREAAGIQLGGGLFNPPVPVVEIRAEILERLRSLPQGAERVAAVAEDSARLAAEMAEQARRSARRERWWSFGIVGALGGCLLLPRLVPALEEHAAWLGLLLGAIMLVVIVRFRKLQARNTRCLEGIGTADPALPEGSGRLPENLESPLRPDP